MITISPRLANHISYRAVGTTSTGRSISWYVDQQIATGAWREEVVPANIVGLSRPVVVLRAARKTNLIAHGWHGDGKTFCPPLWWDLAIGSGACGLGCRSCFLMLTHRIKRDPLRHLLYDNAIDFVVAAEKWLKDPRRRPQHTLGIGIDRSDSLLYEGITYHARNLAPLFADPGINRHGNKLVVLTKSANVKYLADISPSHRSNAIVSFSLNPESIADLWEGKWPDTGERITPSISERLEAAKCALDLGFDVRVRIDPILPVEKWEEQYSEFLVEVKSRGVRFGHWTLGTYREKNTQLDSWRERWGLPPMEWQPSGREMVHDGTHRHLLQEARDSIYCRISQVIRREYPTASVSLCKETHSVRRATKLHNAECNCLV